MGSACDAEGVCGRCGLRVLSGDQYLNRENPVERQVKRDNGVEEALRLSCVTRVQGGPVVITADYW